MLKINIPQGVKSILESLHGVGYEAYVVGGCVRDSLLGKSPKDWDICTSAKPDEIKMCLNYETIDTGLKHGTITVKSEDGYYEVTTYRKDGNYSDHRHPDSVEFVDSLSTDLSRRDFTINAIAYNDKEGCVDIFGGMLDLDNGIIKCVGDPNDRFSEDALRILRAMRFASVYGFEIETNTSNAIHANRHKLNNVAYERIQVELVKILKGENVLQVLLNYSDVIATIIPELKPCIGFDQNNKYHEYTIYDHIAHAVANYTGDDTSVKVTLLLHDIGKPQCYTEDENGRHFHGHSIPSCDLADAVLTRLRFDNKTRFEVLELVLYHDSVIAATPKTIRRWLNKIGEKRLRQLIEVRKADIAAHKKGTYEERLKTCDELLAIVDDVISKRQCFSIKDLSINGYDIINLGVPQGKLIGDVLKYVLNKVINNEVNNDKNELIPVAKNYLINERGVNLAKSIS